MSLIWQKKKKIIFNRGISFKCHHPPDLFTLKYVISTVQWKYLPVKTRNIEISIYVWTACKMFGE